MTEVRRALGQRGEALAAQWYRERGYVIIDSNWRCRDGELDLVVRLGPLIAFCEVKTRTTDTFGVPAEAVTRAKQIRVRRLAGAWLNEHDAHASEVRFDVASVSGGNVEVIENAF
jgi:putative endonuclease